MLVGTKNFLKQIIWIKHNGVKNPNWSEANQLAVITWPRIWTRDYREEIQLVIRAGLELEASELQVQRTVPGLLLCFPFRAAPRQGSAV